jgi:hypothetical protein
MHGMLSAAILILVFVLVTVACGGTVVWLYRSSSPASGYSRSLRAGGEAVPAEASAPAGPAEAADPAEAANPVCPVPDTVVDAPAPRAALQDPEGHLRALPAATEPRELEAPPATESPEPAETPAEPNAAAGTPGDGQASEGARIYVLDSSRRSSR